MPDQFMGRYTSLGLLGKGSMGQVWLAHPLGQPDKRLVVKIMHPAVASQPRFRQLFEREIQSMAKLKHPYIVQLLDFSSNDPHGPSLVMEFVPGVTLEALLDQQMRLSVGHVGLLLGYLCHALEAAHAIGIVHRDLKPANLMVVGAGTLEESVKVMDFGLAQLAGKPHITAERLAGAEQLSASGTPSYICPESLRGDEVDPRADIYSIGVMLYEMLTGQLPFPYTDVNRILRAHLNEKPMPLAVAGARDVPPAVEAVINMCLAKFAVERPQTAREVATRFSEALGLDIWEAARPEGTPEPVAAMPTPKPAIVERNAIVHQIDAWMPERIAVVKLRGFLEDLGGKVTASEPGLLKMRLGTPAASQSGRINIKQVKKEHPPVEIELRMEKPDPRDNRLSVTAVFRPFTDPVLFQMPDWRNRCQFLYKELQSYLMAR